MFQKHIQTQKTRFKGHEPHKVDSTLFIKTDKNHLLLVQIYVDDIIFGSTNETLCENFAKSMQSEFEMSMMGELKYFLRLKIKQSEDGIYISQGKYLRDILRKFGMDSAKSIGTPIHTSAKLDKDTEGKPVD